MPTSADVQSRPGSQIGELESFVTRNPGNAAAHFRLGQLYHADHDRQRALGHLTEAVRLSPENLNFRKLLADFQYVEMGDLESALTNYVAILNRDPKNIENLTILGNIALSMSRFGEARTFFSTVSRLEPWNTDVRMILEAIERKLAAGPAASTYQAARELAEGGRTDEAIRALEQIVGADPRHALAHNDLGVLYGARGDHQKALEHARAAVQSEPDNIMTRKNLGDLYQALLHQPEDAMQQYLEVLRRAPADVETLLSIGSLCVSLGRRDEARGFFEMILRHQPGHLQARELIARLEAGRAPEPVVPAVADPMDSFSTLFDDPKIERILREKERYAREYLNDVLRQEPGNRSARRELEGLAPQAEQGTKDVRPQYSEATGLAARGDVAGARRLLRQIVELDPSFAPAHNDLAVLSMNDGDPETARRHYERAVELAPESVVFRKNLGDFYFAALSQAESALEQYVKVLERDPRDTEAMLRVGNVCESLRRTEDAAVFYKTVLRLEPENRIAVEGLTRLSTG